MKTAKPGVSTTGENGVYCFAEDGGFAGKAKAALSGGDAKAGEAARAYGRVQPLLAAPDISVTIWISPVAASSCTAPMPELP